jgi:hypothetical protein
MGRVADGIRCAVPTGGSLVSRLTGRTILRIEVEFAVAAVAATAALLAKVVIARVFGAFDTNVDRFLLADGAVKRREDIH